MWPGESVGVVAPDVRRRGDRAPERGAVVRAVVAKRGGICRTLSCLHVEFNAECVLGSTAGKAATYGAKPPSPNVAICHIKSFNNN